MGLNSFYDDIPVLANVAPNGLFRAKLERFVATICPFDVLINWICWFPPVAIDTGMLMNCWVPFPVK